jgi:hypothetical protein
VVLVVLAAAAFVVVSSVVLVVAAWVVLVPKMADMVVDRKVEFEADSVVIGAEVTPSPTVVVALSVVVVPSDVVLAVDV